MLQTVISEIHLRTRLVRRVAFRMWRHLALARIRSFIDYVEYEDKNNFARATPSIVLSNFNSFFDFLIISFLFRNKELTIVSPRNLSLGNREKSLRLIRSINHMVYLDQQPDFRFYREILRVLRDFNRSLVIAPEAARSVWVNMDIAPSFVAKIAMMANVPIQPITIRWKGGAPSGKTDSRCWIQVQKKIYVSPRNPEFKDVFFKRRGARKYRKLDRSELNIIGERIFSKIEHG